MYILLQVVFMMNFLEANHYKIAKFFAELDHSQVPNYKYAKYIEMSRDKQVRLKQRSMFGWGIGML